MKREYPGIRKVMAEGYRQLNEKDFFGISKIPDLSSLNLIDRINLYFKAGYQCGVRFTAEEKVLVDAVERTESVEEVIDLAKKVYDFSKASAEKKMLERKLNITAEDLQDQEQEDEFDPISPILRQPSTKQASARGGGKSAKSKSPPKKRNNNVQEAVPMDTKDQLLNPPDYENAGNGEELQGVAEVDNDDMQTQRTKKSKKVKKKVKKTKTTAKKE